jgi:SRSO17 transposase
MVDGDPYVQEHWAKPRPMRTGRTDTGLQPPRKTAIVLEQAQRVLAAGVAVDWAADHEAYGCSSKLRSFFEENAIGYIFAVGVDFQVPAGVRSMRADLLAARKVPEWAWNRLSCGQGAKGTRVYYWALIATAAPPPGNPLLVRRSADPAWPLNAYVAPGRCMTQACPVKIAEIRWAVEENFANGKDAVGLDRARARHHPSWHRHVACSGADGDAAGALSRPICLRGNSVYVRPHLS